MASVHAGRDVARVLEITWGLARVKAWAQTEMWTSSKTRRWHLLKPFWIWRNPDLVLEMPAETFQTPTHDLLMSHSLTIHETSMGIGHEASIC